VKALGYLQCDFFISIFFLLSGLGAGIAPKALAGVTSPAKGRVCFGGATAMVTIELRLAAGSDCPSAAPAESGDGSTVVEGMLCSLTVSSLTSSSTVTLACLGFRELISKNQEEGKQSKVLGKQ
jgi:hypothetical protein